MAADVAWDESAPGVAGCKLRLLRGGAGRPVLVLHHDLGTLDRLPFYDALARRFDVLLPHHPGFGGSERPAWLRSPRDIAAMYQALLTDLDLAQVSLLGLGLGGWIAAEMASLAPRDFHRLVLVGAMGVKPPAGDILDQALLSYIDYARAGFHGEAAFAAAYGAEPSTDQLVAWDIAREMCFRIAWKPYMYSQTLPHLLGSMRAPSLIVWGEEDRVVPQSAGKRYLEALPNAWLEIVKNCGHCVDMEQPEALARLVANFVGRE